MPTLTNNTSKAITLPFWGGKQVRPGESIKVSKYFAGMYELGFTITNELLSPILDLHAAGLPVSLTDLADYQQLLIANTSGGIVSCVINGDSDHPFSVQSGQVQPISLNDDIWSLAITGSGGSNIYVTAVRKAAQSQGATQWQI